MQSKEQLAKAFFTRIPKVRKANPMWQAFFAFFYEAHCAASPGKRVLNIYASRDFSGNREEVYREEFFRDADYVGVDYWEDAFIAESGAHAEKHCLPFPDASFDILVTTKIVLEHMSDPQKVVSEFRRVLRPGGSAFLVAPLVRRQHQKPHDYFRFTEFGIEMLCKKAGFQKTTINHSNGFMVTAAAYAYFFQRGLGLPRWLEKVFDVSHYWIVEPIAFFLDRFDNGYGRDMTQYFLVRADV